MKITKSKIKYKNGNDPKKSSYLGSGKKHISKGKKWYQMDRTEKATKESPTKINKELFLANRPKKIKSVPSKKLRELFLADREKIKTVPSKKLKDLFLANRPKKDYANK